jgi:hypothetical protein
MDQTDQITGQTELVPHMRTIDVMASLPIFPAACWKKQPRHRQPVYPARATNSTE